MPAAPPDPSAAPVREALRIGAGLDAVTVSGLTGEERDEVLRSWSRCGVETVELTEDADAHRGPEHPRSWLDWHENLVFLATSRAIESARGTHLMFHAACLAAPDTGAAYIGPAQSPYAYAVTGNCTQTRKPGPAPTADHASLTYMCTVQLRSTGSWRHHPRHSASDPRQ